MPRTTYLRGLLNIGSCVERRSSASICPILIDKGIIVDHQLGDELSYDHIERIYVHGINCPGSVVSTELLTYGSASLVPVVEHVIANYYLNTHMKTHLIVILES